MKPCDYVYLNLKAKPATRAALSLRVRNALARGDFVHWVDPCVLPSGHKGQHVLTTMARA